MIYKKMHILLDALRDGSKTAVELGRIAGITVTKVYQVMNEKVNEGQVIIVKKKGDYGGYINAYALKEEVIIQ